MLGKKSCIDKIALVFISFMQRHRAMQRKLAVAALCIGAFSPPAQALTFLWSWDLTDGLPGPQTGSVTGTISGLADNQPNQITGVTVTVTSAPNTPPGGWRNDWLFKSSSGLGFSVSNGAVTLYDAEFTNSNGDSLFFGDGSVDDGRLYAQLVSKDQFYNNVNFTIGSVTTFTPTSDPAPVPGPLPLAGAAAAFGLSRRLRRRLKAAARELPWPPYISRPSRTGRS